MSGNELIAEFMGFEKTGTFYDTADERHNKYKSELFGYTYPGEWAFHIKWDWLMPVVQKISKIHDSNFHYDMDKIAKGDWPKDDEYMSVIAMPLNTPIEEAYKAVVDFIKFYNKTPNP